ncbi:S-adenosylmethionine:tRNA ribosyltransferase-isomerase [Labedaea rhizosphaerae]|uniref:S-adenosylmethionine:tRNA ribosyltransferase-isomerase n=1 Tax=Labedaea rhizosphaerae TaxID=598644 RepID=A0A4V3CZ10_LABRH|nr:S-adenosylmethionine:tRNA ribosyltransferase-isomerase [Labedaea rhizosphaerae]TDP96188.1 S-adenosylmethionine:tRNA ribosyltransferase-isomerase [Labedaea rhizosphaerae]
MTLTFTLPGELSAAEPPEARGLTRDGVRLLVAGPQGLTHTTFAALPDHLRPGDLVVINTSPTLAAAVEARRADGRHVAVHFAGHRPDGSWVVEIRPARQATGPVQDIVVGERFTVSGLTLIAREPVDARLWTVTVDGDVLELLASHGKPISYAYVHGSWPIADYQTVFAQDDRGSGSAEMPSAGRPFSTRTITDLVAKGVAVAPIVLHTGVSSAEKGEPPQAEPYRVPAPTARLVELTRANGGRVVAVGTTVTRALETVADPDGTVHAGEGWTELVLGPDRPARVVTGLVTGWHAPGASHLSLLEAVAGQELVAKAYAEAVARRYLWHEFGDSCLLLP